VLPYTIQRSQPHISASIVTAVEQALYLDGNVKLAPKIVYETSLPLENNLTRLGFKGASYFFLVKALKKVSPNQANSLLECVNHYEIYDSVNEFNAKDKKARTDQTKNNLLKFISTIRPNEMEAVKLIKLVKLVQAINQIKDAVFYYPEFNNDKALFNRLWNVIQTGEINIRIITCPDYSLTETTDAHDNPILKYDFKKLGTGEGLVTERSFDVTRNLVAIFERFDIKIRVDHLLPTFEFLNNYGKSDTGEVIVFKGEAEQLSYSECINRLEASLDKIKVRYAEMGVLADTALSSTRLSDADFTEQKNINARKIKELAASEQEFAKYLRAVYYTRKALYAEWYKRSQDETEEIYQARIINEIIISQLAEYMTIGENLTREPNSLLMASDSPIMSEMYAYLNIPALYGRSKNIKGYIGG
jgi:hypothetical protein